MGGSFSLPKHRRPCRGHYSCPRDRRPRRRRPRRVRPVVLVAGGPPRCPPPARLPPPRLLLRAVRSRPRLLFPRRYVALAPPLAVQSSAAAPSPPLSPPGPRPYPLLLPLGPPRRPRPPYPCSSPP